MRRVAALLLALAVAVAPLHAQRTPAGAGRAGRPRGVVARLGIAAVGDSTITLRIGAATWLRPNQRGIVVDPRANDALVARFRLLSVTGDSAVAVLTGLTSPVARHHAAIVEQPRRHWYRENLFWLGAVVGAAAGVLAGLAF